jgi:hypothetical protein
LILAFVKILPLKNLKLQQSAQTKHCLPAQVHEIEGNTVPNQPSESPTLVSTPKEFLVPTLVKTKYSHAVLAHIPGGSIPLSRK